MESVKICRFKTFWMRIFARGTLLLFRCFNIHVTRSYYRKENAADVLTNQELLFHVTIVSVTRTNFRFFGLSSKFVFR